MSTFKFRPTVASLSVAVRACLGASTSTKLNANDIGKPVKLGTADNYVLCAQGDDIEGFLETVEDATYNDGFSYGTIRPDGRFYAIVDAAEAGTLTPRTLVVAGTNTARNTASVSWPIVQKGVDFALTEGTPNTVTAATPVLHKWRVISIVSGTGVAGDTVLIEKV